MSAHTPGPWVVDDVMPVRRGIAKRYADVMVVAEQGGMPGIMVSCGTVEPRDHANARLIAAAPDLLAACDAAIAYDAAIQRHAIKGKSWVDGDDLDALYLDWITKARAAINRTRGRK